MSHPSIADLFASIDHLPYHRRMALFAARARQLDADELDAVLAVLRTGDQFEREVGLFIAQVAGRSEAVREYLGDADWRIGERTLRFLIRGRLVDASTLAEKVIDAPANSRRALYRELRRARATGLADELVDRVRAEFGDAEAASLLPACEAATLARLLPDLGHAVGNWATMAKRHPEVVLAEASRQLAELTDAGRGTWWARYGGVVAAGPRAPHAVLELLERFAPAAHLPGELTAYGVLAAADPARVLALLTAPGRAAWVERVWLPSALLDRLGRLAPTMLTDLARAMRGLDHQLAALLEAMPPSRRAALFEATYADVSLDLVRFGPTLLDALPRALRVAQAQRMLRLAAIRDSEQLTLVYTAYLDWSLEQAVLSSAAGRGEPEERARAWELLVECAARSGPNAVTEAIGMMRRLRNEQDPVRLRALVALAGIPGWLLEPEAAEPLGEITADAVQARDASVATVRAVVKLAVTALRRSADGSGDTSATLLEFAQRSLGLAFSPGRAPSLPRLDTVLRRGQEVALFAAVRQSVQDDIEHGRYESLLTLATMLGRRAWALTELQSLLDVAVHRANVSTVVRQAIGLWLADPAHRSTRVEAVLAFDPSTVQLAEVWGAVEARRTDLLDAVLTGPGPAGRFLASGVRWVPAAARYSRRWLPRQRAAYVELLAQLAADEGIPAHSRAAAIAAAGRVGAAGVAVVRRHLDSPEVTLAEAALGALVWTDRPDEALALLLTYVDGDRARVAVYAAGRAAAFVPPSRVRELLGPVASGTGKITSRKEALRLISRFGGRGCGGVLRTAWLAPDQHRDVRAAIVSTARQRLDEPECWPILEEAATAGRYDVRALVGASPLSITAADRARYAALVVRACTHPDREAARAAWAVLARWTQWTPDVTDLLVGQLSDLEDLSLWSNAIQSLVALVGQGSGAAALGACIEELMSLDAEDPTGDDPEVDRPAYRRLESLVENLAAWTRRGDAGPARPALASAAQQLATESDRRDLGGRLLTQALSLEPEALVGELDQLCLLLTEPIAASAVTEVAQELTQRLERLRPPDPGYLREAAEHLAGRTDVASGLMALAIAEYGVDLGWPDTWRALVHRLRRHESADVRFAALRLETVAD